MAIDKEDINANANLLSRYFHQVLQLALTSLSDSTILKPRNGITPNLVGNFGIVSSYSAIANAASSEYSLKVGIRWVSKSFIEMVRHTPAICCLVNNFILSATV